jgi:hypothetical protein
MVLDGVPDSSFSYTQSLASSLRLMYFTLGVGELAACSVRMLLLIYSYKQHVGLRICSPQAEYKLVANLDRLPCRQFLTPLFLDHSVVILLLTITVLHSSVSSDARCILSCAFSCFDQLSSGFMFTACKFDEGGLGTCSKLLHNKNMLAARLAAVPIC